MSARERILSAALEALSTAVVLVDAQQRVVYCNPAAMALVGADVEALKRQPFMRAFRIRPRSMEASVDPRFSTHTEPPDDVFYELKGAMGWVPVRYHRRAFADGLEIVEMQDIRDEHERELRIRRNAARAAGIAS